jgi:hypothetical protein
MRKATVLKSAVPCNQGLSKQVDDTCAQLPREQTRDRRERLITTQNSSLLAVPQAELMCRP